MWSILLNKNVQQTCEKILQLWLLLTQPIVGVQMMVKRSCHIYNKIKKNNKRLIIDSNHIFSQPGNNWLKIKYKKNVSLKI